VERCGVIEASSAAGSAKPVGRGSSPEAARLLSAQLATGCSSAPARRMRCG
jgi:hypothetical protein